MTTKKLIKAGVNRFGGTSSRYPSSTILANPIRTLLQSNDITVVLDVGAFRSKYCKMLRDKVRYRGHFASFEPCAEPFRALNTQMSDDPN
jgi:hypothetical protein